MQKGAYHGRPADVWAAGVSLCMMVSGKLPFEADDLPSMFQMIKISDPVIPDDITDECAELLRKLLIKDPSRRPTVAALRTDDWVTLNGIDPLPDQSDLLTAEIEDDAFGGGAQLHAAARLLSKTSALRKSAGTNSNQAQVPVRRGSRMKIPQWLDPAGKSGQGNSGGGMKIPQWLDPAGKSGQRNSGRGSFVGASSLNTLSQLFGGGSNMELHPGLKPTGRGSCTGRGSFIGASPMNALSQLFGGESNVELHPASKQGSVKGMLGSTRDLIGGLKNVATPPKRAFIGTMSSSQRLPLGDTLGKWLGDTLGVVRHSNRHSGRSSETDKQEVKL